MAISKVGLGWPVGERQYITLAAWVTALKASGSYEEAWCSGNLGTSFVTITSSDFLQGARIWGDVQYTGANHAAIAALPRSITVNSTANILIQDISCTNANTTQPAMNLSGANVVAERCYAWQTVDPGSNAATLMVTNYATARNCVAVNTLSTASKVIRPSANGIIKNCIGVGGKYALFSEWTTSKTEKSYGVGASVSSCLWGNGRPPANVTNASEDSSGDVGFQNLDPIANFVDYANGDYRIRASSPLHAAGIGAFFEDTAYIGEGIISVSAAVTAALASAKVGSAVALAVSAAQAAAQGSKIGAVTLSLPIAADIVLSASKVGSASFSMPINAVLGIAAHKVGVAPLYIEAVADVSLYAGNIYIGEGTFTVTVTANVALKGEKVGQSQVQFVAAAALFCTAAKLSGSDLSASANATAQLKASKTTQSTTHLAASASASVDSYKVGLGTVAALSSVTISLSGNNPAAAPAPVTFVFVRSSSRHIHNVRSSSRYNYNIKTSSGGARV